LFFNKRVGEQTEFAIAAPYWTVSWDLLAWMGMRRYSRHWSVPQIRLELWDQFGHRVSADWVEDYLRRYEVMVAGRERDIDHLRQEYAKVDDVILTIDGLQPEKGHETLYVVRDLRAKRVWFAVPLLSSAVEEVRVLFERAKKLAEDLGKPVRCWMSDKQEAFVRCVGEVFPGVPHRYCNNHFLRDLAKPVLEKDSHAKVKMRRKVRGLRAIEKKILAEIRGEEQQDNASVVNKTPERATGPEVPPKAPMQAMVQAVGRGQSETGVVHASAPDQRKAVLDYCAIVRGILNDDQGGPLHPPGVRMDAALGEVQDSIGRLVGSKKGGPMIPPATRPKTPKAPKTLPRRIPRASVH
jgi:hypothetical protein